MFCLRPFFLVTVVDQMVLGPVSCPAEVLYAADFALRNGKFSRLQEGDSLSYPLKFHPRRYTLAKVAFRKLKINVLYQRQLYVQMSIKLFVSTLMLIMDGQLTFGQCFPLVMCHMLLCVDG